MVKLEKARERLAQKLRLSLPPHHFFDPPRIFYAVFCGFLYAVAIKYFIMPTQVILTGSEGIAAAFSYYFDSKFVFIYLYLIFQTSLLIFGFITISRKFAVYTALLVGVVAFFLSVLPAYQFADPEPRAERILLVIFAGIISGLAKALAIRNGVSTGDDDIVCTYIAHKYRRQLGSIAIFAAIIPIAFGLILNFLKTDNFEVVCNQLMYTVIYVFMNGQTLNSLYRKYRLCNVMIVTANPESVANAIAVFSDKRTYTSWRAVGGYTKTEKHIFYAITQYEDVPNFSKIIKTADNGAFITFHEIDGLTGNFHIEPMD